MKNNLQLLFKSILNSSYDQERRFIINHTEDEVFILDLRTLAIKKISYKTIFANFSSRKKSSSIVKYNVEKNYTNKLEVDSQGQIIYLLGKNDNESKKFRGYNTWENKIIKLADMPKKLIDIDSIIYKSELFIFGGSDDNDDYLTLVYCYDQNKNEWKGLSDVSTKRKNKTLCVINNKLYVLLGEYEDEEIPNYDIEVMDLSKRESWEHFVLTGIETPFKNCAYFTINEKYLMLFGGERTDNDEEDKKAYIISLEDFNCKDHFSISESLIIYTPSNQYRNIIATNAIDNDNTSFNIFKFDN